MKDAEDLDGFAEVVEAQAVVAEAEAQFDWVDVGQAFDVAVAGEEVIGQAFEQAERCGAVDAAHVGAGQRGPLDPFCHANQPRR